MQKNKIVITAAKRTAVGSLGKTLKNIKAEDLGSCVIREIINNSKRIFLWLSKKSKTSIFKKLQLKGSEIPVNNLNKKKLYCFLVN